MTKANTKTAIIIVETSNNKWISERFLVTRILFIIYIRTGNSFANKKVVFFNSLVLRDAQKKIIPIEHKRNHSCPHRHEIFIFRFKVILMRISVYHSFTNRYIVISLTSDSENMPCES